MEKKVIICGSNGNRSMCRPDRDDADQKGESADQGNLKEKTRKFFGDYRRHGHCIVLSAIMIGVPIPFHPQIPWPLWLIVFVCFVLEAEILFMMIW